MKNINIKIIKPINKVKAPYYFEEPTIWQGNVEAFLDKLNEEPLFDLIVTSPPYNLGKEYEKRLDLKTYISWQKNIIKELIKRLKDDGSICWQIGNYVQNGCIEPLDIHLHPIFTAHGLKLRNRIIWKFGHGLHNKKRFSGRYEVVMWYTKGEKYKFDLDAVRIPSKYPAKKHYKGPKMGKYSSNPLGKNPEDVWEIPNVKSNHIEKTDHPCQFPVGLIERLILSLTKKGDLVFDPFTGAGSSGVASLIHGRRFWGCEIDEKYVKLAEERIKEAFCGKAKYRPHDKPLYDHTKSKLSVKPENR